MKAVRGLAPLAVINSLVMRVCCVGVRMQTLCQMVSCSFSDPKVHSSPRAEEREREGNRSRRSRAKDSKILTLTQRQKIVLCCDQSAPTPPILSLYQEILEASSDSNKK